MDFEIIKNQNEWWENDLWTENDQHLLSIKDKPYTYIRPEIDTIKKLDNSINIIRGPRQVGKTTYLKLLIKKILLLKLLKPQDLIYLSCETIADYKELESTLFPWLKKKTNIPAVLMLDEISFVKEWPRTILSFANQGLLKNQTIFITGSNARDLKESTERLPGRRNKGKDTVLYPFSFKELASLKCFETLSSEQLFETYLKIGGFPHAVKDFVEYGFVSDATYDIYKNWIIGDASRYALLEPILKQILFRVFETLSSRVSFAGLIENTSVKSHETAFNYLEHMEDSFISKILYCYDINKNIPNLSKAKKIYFIDPLIYYMAYSWKAGTRNIYNWVENKLIDPIFKGKMFEATVISNFIRTNDTLYFWYSTKTKKEADILIPNKLDYDLYEIKLNKKFKSSLIGDKNVQFINPDIFMK
ncbi:MAG: ATP-binding protein [Pseudomonadota bacterium]